MQTKNIVKDGQSNFLIQFDKDILKISNKDNDY
jgi:hypothetical protein